MNLRMALRGAARENERTGFGLLTLDVFDTCLIRDFISQESLWYLLGQEIANQLPRVPCAAEFVRLRGRAEDEARAREAGEDIALIDVYARIGANLGWTQEQQRRAVALEEDLEMRSLRPNPRADALLAKAAGVPVAYLTDTPHRGTFIRDCLDKCSLPAGDVLSSGDTGLRKGTGSLFREAGQRFNVGRDRMLHIGNDLRSDAAGSARAGVPFAWFAEANPTRYELALDSATTQSMSLLGAVLAGRGREFRLTKAGKHQPALVSIASGVAGPAVFCAVAWTLLSAQRDRIGTLYFVARDGELLLAVAKLLQDELGLAAGIDCRYLYGSRRSWHLPALSLASGSDVAAALRRLLVQSAKVTLRDLLSHLDLSVDESAAVMGPELASLPADAPLRDRLTEVIDLLAGSPAFRSLALSRAETAYDATVAYLRQEGMFGGGRRAGLVDIGWHGAASASLVAIAAAQGAEVLCYFAGGLCGQGSAVAPRDSRAFLIDARGEEPELRKALVHLMESFCAGSGGSTLGYTETGGRWHPRLAPDGTNRAVSWGLRDFQGLVCEYAAEACRGLVKLGSAVTLEELAAIRPALIGNLSMLWYSPTYREAESWGSFPFEDDQGSPMLGRAVALADVARYLRFLRHADKRPRFGPWGQAVIARTVGGRHFPDPFGSLRIVYSPRQRLMVRAAVRSRLSFRPVTRIGLGNVDHHGLGVRAGGYIFGGGRDDAVDHGAVIADDAVPVGRLPQCGDQVGDVLGEGHGVGLVVRDHARRHHDVGGRVTEVHDHRPCQVSGYVAGYRTLYYAIAAVDRAERPLVVLCGVREGEVLERHENDSWLRRLLELDEVVDLCGRHHVFCVVTVEGGEEQRDGESEGYHDAEQRRAGRIALGAHRSQGAGGESRGPRQGEEVYPQDSLVTVSAAKEDEGRTEGQQEQGNHDTSCLAAQPCPDHGQQPDARGERVSAVIKYSRALRQWQVRVAGVSARRVDVAEETAYRRDDAETAVHVREVGHEVGDGDDSDGNGDPAGAGNTAGGQDHDLAGDNVG